MRKLLYKDLLRSPAFLVNLISALRSPKLDSFKPCAFFATGRNSAAIEMCGDTTCISHSFNRCQIIV